MNIGIDIDDTINNLAETIMPYAQTWNVMHGRDMGPIDPTARHNHEIYGWTHDEMREFKKTYYDRITPKASIKPLVYEAIGALRSSGDKIYFLTARDREWDKYTDPYGITVEWLERHNLSYDGLVVECRDKATACKEYEIDVLIDDTLSTAKKAIAEGFRAILFFAPHNADCGDIPRARSWAEIYYMLKGEMLEIV